ncbi:hypothetical protein GDO86_017336 [Hymenochirus boettgeri]|uniref:P2X purinoreceptor 7 intracellular domain-containing protein n=1 Tax=Hymenochirus boettgeri TaxID=247094 RepID=A0A8T2IJB0_9PIPI|nr:hypothetical protein GDO86_017336 [Hymenochirus boettgeri]
MEEKTSEGGDDNPSENSERCPCGKCVPVPTRVKSLCCHEVEIINGNLVEGALCITDHPFFKQECLSLESVDLTFRFCRADLTEKPREIEYKRELRKVAYRGFKIWIYDHWYNPLPIPTCVVKSIRNAFPDPRGYYAELLPPHDYLEEEMAFG